MSLRVSTLLNKLLILLALALLSACAAPKKPLTGLVPGRSVETLQSSVSLSAHSGEQSSGGRGYLVYRAPDTYHLAVLSPFGQTVLEAFGDGDRFVGVIPSRQVAYRGLLSELPDTNALKNMQLLRWVLAPSPLPLPGPARQSVVLSGVTYYYDEIGMLERKVTQGGDEVLYEGYRTLDGVAFPDSIEIRNPYGASVRIVFDDPQVNAPVEESALLPDLGGLAIRPLSEFKAM